MPRVLSVGQCGFDHGNISRNIRKAVHAEVVRADTFEEAIEALRSGAYALVLINRVFDADGTSGLDLIRTLKADPELEPVPVMLVSGFPDAQQQAEDAGALPGFGKADLADSRVHQRIKTAIAGPSANAGASRP
jgi:two-component system chemotaxis response regulator CheY